MYDVAIIGAGFGGLLIPLIGRPLGSVLRAHGLEGVRPLEIFLDAVCQITVQCASREAEAPFAMGALDYFWRGTGHVRGGIGVLAGALAQAFVTAGGELRLATHVRGVTRHGDRYTLATRRGEIEARQVVANVLPRDLATLLDRPLASIPSLAELARQVEAGWGAVMLYRVVRPDSSFGDAARHFELVADARRPFTDGNHVFVSISDARERERAGPELRTLTASTHVAIPLLLRLGEEERAVRVAQIQSTMRATIAERMPELASFEHELTASPRTFQRFTARSFGFVGGVPRRAGLSHYRRVGVYAPLPGLYLVGDSVFPGQSTLAAALGGVRVAERIMRG